MTAFAQFSPGALSKVHQDLDSPTKCGTCHAGAAGKRKFKCTWCHTEIARRMAANVGLHPSLMAGSRSDDACVKCHSEHNGKEFVPILWESNPAELDHRKTGYPLVGGHASLKCERCHSPAHISAQERKTIRVRDLRRTYLGLQRECMGCHQDEHAGQVGLVCERCHEFTRWKEIPRFDHAAAKFHLAGAHAKVLCAKCHKSEPVEGREKLLIRYTGMPFSKCLDCHQDPHKGSFKAACESCHNEVDWKAATRTATVFDHSTTKFPLLGKHADVVCAKCHKTADFKTPVAHQLCRDCHQDVHNGQFLARADKGECASCHIEQDWKKSTFTVQAHAGSAYPLLGRHATVACAKCHLPAGKATLYRVKFKLCLDCHKDAHDSQFAGLPHANRCEDCHTVERFTPAVFTLARHNETRFPLEGAHMAVSCDECHKAQPAGHGTAAYHFTDSSCAACHQDPHRGQFVLREQQVSSGRQPGCEGCHNVRNWHDVSRFDHSKARFALTGAHPGVPCGQCHRVDPTSAALRVVVYRNTPLQCGECHEDVHVGQFRALTRNALDCGQCHQTGRWRPAGFDHNRAEFRLTGAHKDVPCSGCHFRKQEVSGRLVLFYKPTPKECSGCHGANITR